MSLFAFLFKVIPYLMPFIKEMLIGKKSWGKAFRENRKKTILAIAVIVSVIFNIVLMAKLGSLAYSYLGLSRTNDALEARIHVLENKPVITVGPLKAAPVVITAPEPLQVAEPVAVVAPRPTHTKHKVDNTAQIKAEFERMRRLEAAQGK